MTMLPLTSLSKILKSRPGQEMGGSTHNLRPVMSSPQIIITTFSDECEDEKLEKSEKSEIVLKENDAMNDEVDFSCQVSVVVEDNDALANDVWAKDVLTKDVNVKIELPKFQLQVGKTILFI